MKLINKTVLFPIIINLLLISIFAAVFVNINVFIFGLIFTILGTIFFKNNNNHLKIFHYIYLANIIITLVVYYLNIYEYGTPYYIGGSDDLTYEKDALKVTENLKWYEYFMIKDNIVVHWHNSIGYVYIVSLLSNLAEIFGTFHTLLPRLLNSFLVACTAVLICKISVNYFSLNLDFAKKIAYVVGVFPVISFVAAHSFRDIVVLFIITYTFYLWAMFNGRNMFNKFFTFVISLLLIIVAFSVREIVAYYLVIIIISFLLKINRISLKNLGLACILLFLTFIFYSSNLMFLFEKYSNSYSEYLLARSDGLSNIIFGYDIFPFGIILRTFYAFISPFPSFSNFANIMVTLGTLFQLSFLIFFLKSFLKNEYLEVKIIFLVIFISVITSTFTFRHTLMYLPFAILLGAHQFIKSKEKIRKHYFGITYFFLIMLIIIYFTLKNIY